MAFEWKDLVDGEDYVTAEPINRIAHEVIEIGNQDKGTTLIFIGEANIYSSGKWSDVADVTNSITYKPDFNEAWEAALNPMAFKASYLGGSGDGYGYTFYSHYCYWDYFSLNFDLYFHAYTESGELKVVKLVYSYDEADTSTPKSITAYLVETEAGGVTEEYVNEAIRSAILDSWEAEV